EFLTAKSFKKAAQQGAKAAGFAFSISSSKLACSEKVKFTKRQGCLVKLNTILDEKAGVWVVHTSETNHSHNLLPPSQVHCLHQHRLLNTEQKELVHTMIKSDASVRLVADTVYWKHGTEMSIAEKAFDKVKEAATKSRNLNYIQVYFEEWKQDAECWINVFTKNYLHMRVQSTQ
ncbi:16858_t:CDS:2, partial [Racocetra fulgida]